MKKYSEDIFELKSQLTPVEIADRLQSRTLIKKRLTAEFTDKDFIGKIQGDTFSIFDSAKFPSGVACVMHGEIKDTSEINLTTTLHRGFRILIWVWAFVMTGVFVGTSFIDSDRVDLVVVVIFMPIMILFFRLILHGYYVYARNRGLKKLKGLLKIV
jgi:hypothetical protein